MKTWTTTNSCKIFQVLSGRANAYFVATQSGNMLVDTGKANAYRSLTMHINNLDLLDKNIDYLFLTHTHYDHCQSADYISKWGNCKVIASKHEAGFTKRGYTPLPSGTNPFSKMISALGRTMGEKRFGYPAFDPEVCIPSDIDFSGSVPHTQIIETPGHSAGSISLLVDNEIALVGDALFGIFKNSMFPPFADDVPEMVKSWGKLLETGCHLFLPGHGKPVLRKLLLKEHKKYCNKLDIKPKAL